MRNLPCFPRHPRPADAGERRQAADLRAPRRNRDIASRSRCGDGAGHLCVVPFGRLYQHAAARRGSEFWEAEVKKMIKSYHAPISEADAKTITDYLAKTY